MKLAAVHQRLMWKGRLADGIKTLKLISERDGDLREIFGAEYPSVMKQLYGTVVTEPPRQVLVSAPAPAQVPTPGPGVRKRPLTNANQNAVVGNSRAAPGPSGTAKKKRKVDDDIEVIDLT